MTRKRLLALRKDTRIGVLYGGLSSEREVSLRSGRNCAEALMRLGYSNVQLLDANHDIAQTLLATPIDVVFNVLHGTYGEDGCIQGLLDWMGIPYTGNGVTASALTMDKDLTKIVLQAAGLPVLPWVTLKREPGEQAAFANVRYRGTYPVMVKPVADGSSVGMSKVDREDDLQQAVETAFEVSERVLIEQYIPGKSITVGVLEREGTLEATPILELKTKTEWYDYAAKYTEGLTEFVIPADLPEDVTQAIQEVTIKAHQAAGCSGVSRVDFVVDGENRFFILEINTVPGMTNLSDLPAQAAAMGLTYDQLVECLLKTACP